MSRVGSSFCRFWSLSDLSWVMCPYSAPHGPRPSHRAWARMGPKCMRCTQVAIRAHRRCADDPRRGWGLLGAESRGAGFGGLGSKKIGASGHPRPGPHPNLCPTEARFLAAELSAGIEDHSWVHGAPGPRGPREYIRHPRPRGPPTPAAALRGQKATVRLFWGASRHNWPAGSIGEVW